MDPSNVDYFESSADWAACMRKCPELALKPEGYIQPPLDVQGDRESEIAEQRRWTNQHPLSSFGYTASSESTIARDGHQIVIKIYRSSAAGSSTLPLLFVSHGGGWVQGNPITEESWLLGHLFQAFDFVIVSVDYRLAPEYTCPTQFNDCWDAFAATVARHEELKFDPSRVLFAGSSSGGCLAASLAQKARDDRHLLPEGVSIIGVVLNVPVTCHPDHFPNAEYPSSSYSQCNNTLLTASEMHQIWSTYCPASSATGGHPAAALASSPSTSPLLGDLSGLPPHAIFVAGQDPLRDEGIAYATKLESSGVSVTVTIYPGVPHTFAEIWELDTTMRFRDDLRHAVKWLLNGGTEAAVTGGGLL